MLRCLCRFLIFTRFYIGGGGVLVLQRPARAAFFYLFFRYSKRCLSIIWTYWSTTGREQIHRESSQPLPVEQTVSSCLGVIVESLLNVSTAELRPCKFF